MRFSLRSIYFQVLMSFLFIILSTLTISTVIEYYTYSSQLPQLFTEIQTRTIAQRLSATYTRDNSWDNLAPEIQRLTNLENLNTLEDTTLRIIIRDSDGRTVYNSFLNITRIENNELIEGESQPVIDFKTAETVGVVTVYISKSYILAHAHGYVIELIKSGIYKGLITAGIAVILSLWFSRRITQPVIQLTDAAQIIADGGKSGSIQFTSSNELGRLSTAFSRMQRTLQAQRDLRKQLLTDVSHEINTPLNAIRLEARGLSDGLVSPEEASYHIIDEIDALRNIIYDLDWLAETDSGAYILNMEEYPISRLVTEETGRWSHKAETRNVTLKVEGCSGLPSALIDVVRISTVVGNLIDNAVKYAPSGSRVTIKCAADADSLTVSVCDEGPAIPPEDRIHVFERFYRAPRGGKQLEPGRGLGLSIVKQIIELHNGSISLESGESKGNCFIFSLPAVREE